LYIGAHTRQSCRKRDAWYVAIALISGSFASVALGVFWSLTVG
jgi:hypothetical protein